MNIESLLPFLVILSLFGFAILLEAAAIYFLKVQSFWKAVGLSFLINILGFVVLYFFGMWPLSKIGYEFNGLQLPVQVVFFLWWLSVMFDGFILHLFSRGTDKKQVFFASVVMNVLSYLFLYFFIVNSH